MTQRLADYGIVLGVVLVLVLLFRLSRNLLHRFTLTAEKKNGAFSLDDALVWGMRFLLTGLLLLPFVTSILAFVDNRHLTGGIVLHLCLTAVSVILFSFAEDLFRDYNSYGGPQLRPVSWHWKRVMPLLLGFWVIGSVFLSPLFYSGLTVLAAVFYRLCLFFRRAERQSARQ